MRADVYLTEKGMCESRSKAKSCIEEGLLFVNGANVKKCSYDISESDVAELRGEVMPFVSRGGLKLLGALDTFALDVKDLVCADIGASTGGFTDCLLQNGAKRVYAVDCGSGQLHQKLKNDERVKSIEALNARELTCEVLGEKCDLAVMDVSFISQTLLYGAVRSVLKDGGTLISLIKPQFECGRAALGRGGIVKDRKVKINVIRSVVSAASDAGLTLTGLAPSPIKGGDGNEEYLAEFVYGGKAPLLLSETLLRSVTEGAGSSKSGSRERNGNA